MFDRGDSIDQWSDWGQPDRPNFAWEGSGLAEAAARFLVSAGVTAGILRSLEGVGAEAVTIVALTSEALTTSEVEGDFLDRESVQSSLRRDLGLAMPTPARPCPAEDGIADLMVDLYRSFRAPLDHETVFAWHVKIVRARRELHDLGRYRTHDEPMEVDSGRLDAPQVHFEAPFLPGGQRDGRIHRLVAAPVEHVRV